MKNDKNEKIILELTPLQVEIISHLVSNELVVNQNSIGILMARNKPITKKSIEAIQVQSSQLKELQKVLKKAVK